MKRGATVLNYVLILGTLFVAFIVMLNLQKIAHFEAEQLESDVALSFLEDLKETIEIAESYPSDMKTTIEIPFIREYDFEITHGVITMYFPREDLTFTKPYSTANLNIMSNKFSDSGKIYIYAKDRNFLVTNELWCDLTDSVCDASCAYYGQCDPACYDQFTEDLCNPYCVDTNNDRLTNGDDADSICDPDCYNTNQNGGYYDVDCIESFDGICDPDTHNIYDTVCDADCKQLDGICDPDCGTDDLDCPYKTEDDVCETEKRENCLIGKDCLCPDTHTCKVGCVDYQLDEMGCVHNAQLKYERNECRSDCDCVQDLECDSGHCCPQGLIWNETSARCVVKPSLSGNSKFKLVVVPVNFNFPSQYTEYRQIAETFMLRWKLESPFRECSNKDELMELLLLNEDCTAAIDGCKGGTADNPNMCNPVRCQSEIYKCVASKYTDYDKVEAVFYGDMEAGLTVGCAPLSNLLDPDPYFSGHRNGFAIHAYPQSNTNMGGSIHELGHDFGLCHTKCTGGCFRPDDPADYSAPCPNNDPCEPGKGCYSSIYVMSYGIKQDFAPEAYTHLKNHIYLKEFLERCEP
jgi:hypothetical protein